ncbi:hypothetical protein IV498_00870 [Paenarthrobacter sp. Z7-10]|uniref:hypothetical protein n=1 Tax=Paenarthrobacter sp. Z7-10 TaxID=2787635 RepID=UPI0022A9BDD8|nr:hypothetical protein [Paenarthrobacter sp. Z7-10]MCZ2401771.1 hypothetical protein [Paenarthrobacter sp. Z7-10]
MSTPYENPNPEQAGSQSPAGGEGASSGGAPRPSAPGYEQPGYQQPGYQQPGYQQPGYQAPQGPPAYQQPADPGYGGGMVRGAKSPAANFSNFPARLKNLGGIPKEIKNAYLLFLLGAALNLLSSLINLIAVGSQRSALYVGASVFGFIIAIIFTAIVVWLSLLMKERVNWARIVMIVIAALNVIGALTSLIGLFLGALNIIGLLGSVAFVVGGIMLLMPAGRAYYANRNAVSYPR